MSTKIRLVFARSGVGKQSQQPYGTLGFVVPVPAYGTTIDTFCSLFINGDKGKTMAEALAARLVAAKDAKTNLTVTVEGLVLKAERSSTVNAEGVREYRENVNIDGGRFGAVTEEARTSSRAEIDALAS